MTEGNTVAGKPPLELLPFQLQLVDFLKRHDRALWDWFASSKRTAEAAEELKFDLLKSTYRIERDSQPSLYQLSEEVAQQLGLAAPITIYQAQDPGGLNASLAYLPEEIHVILHGPLTSQLEEIELRGLFGHEFTHFLLWQSWNGDLLVAVELLQALTNDARAHPAHFASWRLLTLYNEILCDRGALVVTQNMRSVVSMLVKVQTGVKEIDPDSYLRQADEIFARGKAKTEGLTHPEAFIRARAIKLWADNDPRAAELITAMIEADTELNQHDLLAQDRVAGWTRRVIDLLLAHPWFQTELVLGHARLYFSDYVPPSAGLTDSTLANDIRLDTKSLKDYFCFVLLDFISADRDLDEPALAAALQVAELLQIKDRLIELTRQELKLRKNQIERVDDKKATILQEAAKAAGATT